MNGNWNVGLGRVGLEEEEQEEGKGCREKRVGERLHEGIREAQELTNGYFEEMEEFTLFFNRAHRLVDRKSEYGLGEELKAIQKQVKAMNKLIAKHKGSGKELLGILALVLDGNLKSTKVKSKVDLTDIKKYCFVYTSARSKTKGYSRVVSQSVYDKKVEEVCIGDRFPNCSISCRISDQRFFLYIGQFGTKSLLIDLDESIKEPQLRKESVKKSQFNHIQSAFVLFDRDKIGFFGAEGVKSEFFELESKNWFALPDLPYEVNQPTACALQSKVYIVDQVHPSLIIFCVSSLTYTSLNLSSLQPNTQKLIFSLQGQIFFLLQAKTLLTYDPSSKDFTVSKTYPKIQPYQKTISFPLLYNSTIYFLTNNRKLLKLPQST